MSLTFGLFFVLGILAIASGIVTISNKSSLVSAIALIFHFFMLAGIYLTLSAQFIAVMQILVYAGAIMVLVVFVIMLLNLGKDGEGGMSFNFRVFLSVLFGLALIVQLASIILIYPAANNMLPENAAEQGSIQNIGGILFSKYLFPFEAIGILLLAAIIGAVVLAKRKID